MDSEEKDVKRKHKKKEEHTSKNTRGEAKKNAGTGDIPATLKYTAQNYNASNVIGLGKEDKLFHEINRLSPI